MRVGDKVYDILTVYLENGLRVILHKIPNMKTMSCGIWIKQGSRHEDDRTNGLSHLIEHLMINKDNKNNPKFQRLMNDICNNGVVYNAGTTKENTFYYFIGLSKVLNSCLETISSIVIQNKTFDEELFENEKKVVIQEAISFYSSFNQIKERSTQALWGNMGVGKIIVGSIDCIKSSKIEDVEEIIDKSYTPENATLVVIGGIDYYNTLDFIYEYFSDWKDKKTRQYHEVIESEPGIYFNKNDNGKSSVVSVCFRTPSYLDSNRNNIEVISRMLGNSGLQSRLVNEIRMKKGLAYLIGSFTSFYEARGTLGFTVVCEHESVYNVLDIMINELNKVTETGFDENEIERCKKGMETQTLLYLDDITSQLKFLGRIATYGHLFSLEQELRNIQKIDRQNINRLAKDLFTSENMGFAAIGKLDLDNAINKLKLS